jgi:hypothetical protein
MQLVYINPHIAMRKKFIIIAAIALTSIIILCGFLLVLEQKKAIIELQQKNELERIEMQKQKELEVLQERQKIQIKENQQAQAVASDRKKEQYRQECQSIKDRNVKAFEESLKEVCTQAKNLEQCAQTIYSAYSDSMGSDFVPACLQNKLNGSFN